MWPSFSLIPILRLAAKANQYSPTAGKIWPGTPVSDILVGQKAAPKAIKGTATKANIPTGISNDYAWPNRAVAGGGGGGGGGSFNADGGGGDNYDAGPDLAYQAWRAAIDQANRIRSSGKATFDDLIKSVTGFRDRAKTQFNDAGQQITNTAAEILGSNARTADELRGQVQSQGRALGLGDSSRFNRQNKVAANLASTQGSTLANRGENERANRGVYDERLGRADEQEGQANSYLRNINDAASAVEAGGVQNYGNALNDVLNYQRQLAAINPLQAGGLQQYAPNVTGIQNTLGSVLSGMAARPIQGGDMAANPVSPVDYLTRLKQQRGIYV